MRCHYCEGDADLVVEKEGVRVGLCESHFRERLEDLAESDVADVLGERLDVDRE